jgi:hypothetical protein
MLWLLARETLKGLRNYRQAMRSAKLSPSDLLDLMMRLVSGKFSNFVKLNNPFLPGSIESERKLTAIVPEKVKVGARVNTT